MTLSLMATLFADPEPWLSENFMIYLGAYGGAGIGVIGILGVASLITDVIAVVFGQPYVVYHPFLLLGLITSAVMFSVRPAIAKRYQEAEQRKVEAADRL